MKARPSCSDSILHSKISNSTQKILPSLCSRRLPCLSLLRAINTRNTQHTSTRCLWAYAPYLINESAQFLLWQSPNFILPLPGTLNECYLVNANDSNIRPIKTLCKWVPTNLLYLKNPHISFNLSSWSKTHKLLTLQLFLWFLYLPLLRWSHPSYLHSHLL